MDNPVEGSKKRKLDPDQDDPKRPSSHQPSTPRGPALPLEPTPPPLFPPSGPDYSNVPLPLHVSEVSASHYPASHFGSSSALKDKAPSTNQKFGATTTDTELSTAYTLVSSTNTGPLRYATDEKADLHLSDQDSHLIDFYDDSLLASGGSCETYVAVYRPRNLKLAMKTLRDNFPTEAVLRRFRREAEIWAAFKHPNILPFLGTMRVRHRTYLVSQLMTLGDLLTFVQARIIIIKRGGTLSNELVPLVYSTFNEARTILAIADGLSYLHSIEVVHGDMKAKNVLLDDGGCARICGFDLTKALDHSVTSTQMKGIGSLRWQSPELLHGVPRSPASDVYAFGMTISEVLTGEFPFPHLRVQASVIFAVVIRNERPDFHPSSLLAVDFGPLWDIAAWCWETKPEDRPSMAEVVKKLDTPDLFTLLSKAEQFGAGSTRPVHLSQGSPTSKDPSSNLETPVEALDVASPPMMAFDHTAFDRLPGVGPIAEAEVGETDQRSSQRSDIGVNLEEPDVGTHTTSSWRPLNSSGKVVPFDIPGKPNLKLLLTNQDIPLLKFPQAFPKASGGFGEVHIAIYVPSGLQLAMKRPKLKSPTEDVLRLFRKEAEIWSTLEHPNILPFCGTLQINQRINMASPWMSLGDLLSFVQKRDTLIKEGKLSEGYSDKSIPVAYSRFDETKVLREIATGLEYLHSGGVVHGDIKARNVLLNDDGCAQICDFGLTRKLSLPVLPTELEGGGSLRWLSPEVLGKQPRSEKSDVYAFGMTIVEVLTATYPSPHIKSNKTFILATIVQGERPAFQPMSRLGVNFESLWNLAAECWKAGPTERPPINAVLSYLEHVEPPKLPQTPLPNAARATPPGDNTNTFREAPYDMGLERIRSSQGFTDAPHEHFSSNIPNELQGGLTAAALRTNLASPRLQDVQAPLSRPTSPVSASLSSDARSHRLELHAPLGSSRVQNSRLGTSPTLNLSAALPQSPPQPIGVSEYRVSPLPSPELQSSPEPPFPRSLPKLSKIPQPDSPIPSREEESSPEPELPRPPRRVSPHPDTPLPSPEQESSPEPPFPQSLPKLSRIRQPDSPIPSPEEESSPEPEFPRPPRRVSPHPDTPLPSPEQKSSPEPGPPVHMPSRNK